MDKKRVLEEAEEAVEGEKSDVQSPTVRDFGAYEQE